MDFAFGDFVRLVEMFVPQPTRERVGQLLVVKAEEIRDAFEEARGFGELVSDALRAWPLTEYLQARLRMTAAFIATDAAGIRQRSLTLSDAEAVDASLGRHLAELAKAQPENDVEREAITAQIDRLTTERQRTTADVESHRAELELALAQVERDNVVRRGFAAVLMELGLASGPGEHRMLVDHGEPAEATA